MPNIRDTDGRFFPKQITHCNYRVVWRNAARHKASEQTIEQAIGTLLIWDAMALIMTLF